jgi:hypothetical protein
MTNFRNSDQIEAQAPFVLIVTPAGETIKTTTVGCITRLLLSHGREQAAYTPAGGTIAAEAAEPRCKHLASQPAAATVRG